MITLLYHKFEGDEMINNIEIEYKLLVSKEKFEKLSNLYQNKQFIKQTNTYYDTPNNDLRKKHCAMRIREKDGKFMITLKVPTIRGHEEFECYVSENTANAINQSEVRKVLNELNILSYLVNVQLIVQLLKLIRQNCALILMNTIKLLIMKLNMNKLVIMTVLQNLIRFLVELV